MITLVICLTTLTLCNALISLPSLHRLTSHKLHATTTPTKNDDKIGWDSHKAIESIPDSLVRTIDGNDGIRRKFEQLCRNAQVQTHAAS